MVDSKLRDGKLPSRQQLSDLYLPYFADQLAEEYFTTDVLEIQRKEADQYAAFAKTCTRLLEEATDDLLAGEYREEFGLGRELWNLAAETWRNRNKHPHAFGRFDFAGVIDGQPCSLIEYNADTATVLAEAAIVQPLQTQGLGQAWNDIEMALGDQLIAIANARPPDDIDVLIITLGHGEDVDSAQVWQRAAAKAGLAADISELPDVTISAETGVFCEISPDAFVRYGIVIKLFPWDWIEAEEPELLAAFSQLILSDTTCIINPPYAALWQSKAMLAELYRRNRNEPGILPAGWGVGGAQQGGDYVTKPIFGREGENVSVHDSSGHIREKVKGDFAHQARIWQQYIELPRDEDGDIYQAGIYYAGGACGLAYRRRDGLVVDNDAEFVSAIIKE